MSDLLICRDIEKSIGDRLLFTSITYSIKEREKIGLIGPNGAGKSTFLKILAGHLEADKGELVRAKNSRMVYIPQIEEINPELTVLEAALEALADDPGDDFEKETAVSIALGRIGFDDFSKKVSALSGGWLKRLSIARQVAREPDLLLLDEPTNHLDLEGIEWLESYLFSANFSYVVISHDRHFLEKCTNKTLEINPRYKNTYWGYEGSYNTFIEKKADYFSGEKQRASNLANKARIEDAWLKRGVRARGTKQNARKNSANDLFDEVKDLKNRTREEKKISLDFEATDKKTKRLVVLHAVKKLYGDKNIIDGLDLTLAPGMRVGLLGANGIGKSTLMNIIAGTLEADAGKRNLAHGAKVIKFDQNRGLLDPNVKLREALTPAGSDIVEYRGENIHVASWAQKLRFRSDQLDSPVRALSGGEQARVLMGQLMLQQADILLLDEPTNDLDIPSIEVLEESLMTFPGAVVLVTHDREMISRVSTVLLGFEGDGVITPYVDYPQWQNRHKTKAKDNTQVYEKVTEVDMPQTKTKKVNKFSYKDQREWDGMEQAILEAETALEDLHKNPVDAKDLSVFKAYCHDMGEAQDKIDVLYLRWSELEEQLNATKG
ncbi:MAG: ATP-binding cassette subfamily F protein uup [Alphaproteobacteria bacterium]|jgi:ATP-binding cassette subfamily F protein uup